MADPHPVVSYSKRARFDEVRDDLRLAIEGKGLVIDYHSYVNRMLERTAQDDGADEARGHDARILIRCSG
jgi:hypothetical protein